MSDAPKGLMNGLSNYGDAGFSRYLRRSFASSMGYSRAMLDKPIVGICYAGGGFNNGPIQIRPDLDQPAGGNMVYVFALPQ